jgi:hypothetical protein
VNGSSRQLLSFAAGRFRRPRTRKPCPQRLGIDRARKIERSWVPKAILEVLHFNGDGTLTTPGVTIANPFGDIGNLAQPPSGAPGLYSINEDCSGTVQFLDANNVTYKIFVDPPQGNTIWMIQINPANNVFQGSAKRVW